MRVLITSHNFPPYSPYGGELYGYYLARHLEEAGCDVHVLTPAPDAQPGEERKVGGVSCTLVRGPEREQARSIDTPRADVEDVFRRVLKSFDPHIVHANHLLNLSTDLPRLAKAGSRSAVVMTLHDYWLRCPKVKLLDRWGRLCETNGPWKCASCCRERHSRLWWPSLEVQEEGRSAGLRRWGKELAFEVWERPQAWRRILARDAEMHELVQYVDKFVAPSRFLFDKMVEWGIPSGKVVHHDYGVEKIPYVQRPPGTHRRRPLFGYLGGMTYHKGLQVLINAFRGLDAADLIIYGATRESFEKLFGKTGETAAIRFGGVIDDKAKVSLLPQLDALIVPSIWYENSPIVIHEAFEAGVPVICSRLGGMAELVADGEDGLHFTAGDSDDLRRVIRRCIESPGLLERLRAGVHAVKSMQDHVRNELLPLYRSLGVAA